MRARLIELLREAYDDYICDDTAQQREKLADCLLGNGVVVLPCKVGETVWRITGNDCKDVTIESIHQWSSGHWKFDGFHGEGKYRVGYEFDLNNFGKTVFLTREEAERALKTSKAARSDRKI